jgi:hypothetical protein
MERGKVDMISFEKIRLALGCTAIYGGLVLVAWACGFVVGFPPPWLKVDPPRRSAEQLEFVQTCLEWRAMSNTSRLLAGPNTARDCHDYFVHRSDEDVQEDSATWQRMVKDAQAEWKKSPMDPAVNETPSS